jgi:hypothetical protein
MPDYYYQISNLYSEQEIIVISWLEQLGLTFESQGQRIVNLDQDLKNGLVIASVLKYYVKSTKLDSILNLK